MTPPTATAAPHRTDRYPTRSVDRADIAPRVEPVVWGDAPGPLDPDLVASYEDDGFLVLPGVFGPTEVQQLNEELDRVAADEAARGKPEVIVEPDSNAFRSLFAFHAGTGPLAEAAGHPWLVAAARQLLGSDVYVHQSRANLKPGFRGREFYWHSDFETWHAEDGMPTMRALSCSVTLTDNHAWNGPLLAIAGSHRWFVSCVGETPERHHEQSLRRQQYGTPDDDSLRELVDRGRIEQCVGPAGTVVLFDCNLMHGSAGNISPLPRRNLFVVFNSVENRLEEPFASPAPRPEYVATRRRT
jgi:ectoine hydroxylase